MGQPHSLVQESWQVWEEDQRDTQANGGKAGTHQDSRGLQLYSVVPAKTALAVFSGVCAVKVFGPCEVGL